MKRAILFDLDGTLLNRDLSVIGFISEQYVRFKRHLGHVPKQEYIQRFIDLDQGGYVWKDEVYELMTREFHIEGISYKELLMDYVENFHHHSLPYPNLHRMLAELQVNDIPMGIITNGYTHFQLRNIRSLGIEPFFSAILISEREGIKKPDPEIFLRAVRELGVSANESVYVGDHPINDIRAAQLVGMKAVWKYNSRFDIPHDADFVIDDLYDIVRQVLKLM